MKTNATAVLANKPESAAKYRATMIARMADELGRIKADKADLNSRENEIRNTLIDMGASSGEGDLFRFTLNESYRTVVDYKTIVEVLQPSRQLLTAHTKQVPAVTLRVTSRTGGA